MSSDSEIVIGPDRFDAVIFDLDGVLSDTTHIHAMAWKTVFDDFLQGWSIQQGVPYQPFDAEAEYLAHVDGRAREDGVRQFLAARGIHIPEGPDVAGVDTIMSLAARKDTLAQTGLRNDSRALPGAEAILKALKATGFKTAVASSSANCKLVLSVTGLAPFVDERVDGVVAAQMGLPSKPDPALFLEAARRLNVEPARAALFEDALPGVEAGLRGGFSLVVGVDRGGQASALRAQGAHAVIRDLTQVRVATS